MVKVKLDLIDDGYSPRKFFSVEWLKNSIKLNGLVSQVKLAAKGSRYDIIDGHLRVKALRELGYKEVDTVITTMEELEQTHVAFIENMQRNSFRAVEIADHLRYVKHEFDFSQKDLALKYDMSETMVSEHIQIAKLDKKIKQIALDNDVGSRQLYLITQLLDKKELLSQFEKKYNMPNSDWADEQHAEYWREVIKKTDQQETLLKRIVEKSMTVKQVEAAVAAQLAENSSESTVYDKRSSHEQNHLFKRADAKLTKIENKVQTFVSMSKNIPTELNTLTDEFLSKLNEKLKDRLLGKLDNIIKSLDETKKLYKVSEELKKLGKVFCLTDFFVLFIFYIVNNFNKDFYFYHYKITINLYIVWQFL